MSNIPLKFKYTNNNENLQNAENGDFVLNTNDSTISIKLNDNIYNISGGVYNDATTDSKGLVQLADDDDILAEIYDDDKVLTALTGFNLVSDKITEHEASTTKNHLTANQIAALPEGINSTIKLIKNNDTATSDTYGLIKLSDATNSSNDTTNAIAATPKAVKAAYDLANSAYTAVTTGATSSAFGVVQLLDAVPESESSASIFQYTAVSPYALWYVYDAATKAASTSEAGRVQLSDSTSTTSSTLAATSTAVKAAYDLANTHANNSTFGTVKLSASTSSTSGTSDGWAATPSAVKAAYDLASPTATTSAYGRTKLSNSYTGTSQTLAATEYALNQVYTKIPTFAEIPY